MHILTSLLLPFTLSTLSLASSQGIYWSVPGPIIRLESTYVISAVPLEGNPGGDQGFWMGMEPLNTEAVLQNVVGNIGTDSGEWSFFPEYCCNPNVFLNGYAYKTVYPGDKLQNSLVLDNSTGHWIDNWSVQRWIAAEGQGASDFNGSFEFKPEMYPPQNPYQAVFLTTELSNNATWDWGVTTFLNVKIQSVTTESDWCFNWSTDNHTAVWNISQPTALESNGTVTCYIASVVMNGP